MRPQSRDQAAAILAALGGVDNIDEIEPCTTRLASRTSERSRVDAAGQRAAGAFGVMISGRVVQVVVGPHVDLIATDLDELM